MPQHSPYKHALIIYGAKLQYAAKDDDSSPLDADVIVCVQFIVSTLLFYSRDINNKLLVAISKLGQQQAACCFLLLRIIYVCYEAQGAISLFQMYEFFTMFLGFQTQIFDTRNVRDPIRSANISNEYVSIFLSSAYVTSDTISYCVQTNLFTDDELQLDEAFNSNNPSFV